MLMPHFSFAASAEDEIGTPLYNFKVYVPKNTVGNINFFTTIGFDNDNYDIFNEEDKLSMALDTASDESYDIYTISAPEGTYSYRATDAEGKSLGGGAIKVPTETAVDENESDSCQTEAYLRLSKAYITNEYDGIKATAEDFSVKLLNKIGMVTTGDAFIDEEGYSCYPALILANSNALLYYITATPSPEYADLYSLKEEQYDNISVFKGTEAHSFEVELPSANRFTINAPTGAEVFMYDQILNFNTKRIDPVRTIDNDDSTTDYIFASAGESYRVSMDGKRTQAGYDPKKLSPDGEMLKITFPDADPKEQTDTWLGRKECGVLLNINERNKLSLKIGESYKVRAYRAPWQIVNTDVDNIMIEPDFHYTILSGRDVIDISQTDGGNADGNWANVTAKSSGVAIVEVSYDAIDVQFPKKAELYGATNPRRSGVFIVTVGDEYGDIGGIDIDCEYDTKYFTADNASLPLSIEGEDVSVSVANVWQNNLRTWKNIIAENGVFDVPLANGNNIVKITSGDTTDYRVIRASKLETVITNETAPKRTEAVCAGDKITIGFKGLFQWIPKFSGIYNPSRLYASYNLGEEIIESKKSQFNLPETTLTLTVPDDAKDSIILNNGKLMGNTLGSKWSAHRQLTDLGTPANFNASNLPLADLNMPDLIIPITDKSDDTPDIEQEDNQNGSSGGASSGGGSSSSDKDDIDTSDLKFDIDDGDIDGYVTISFEDYAKRKSGESDITYKNALGEIIEPVEVPFKNRDSIATVTLRLLKALGIKSTYTGKPTNNFYLSTIGDFSIKGKYYSSFGEFDAGAGSGWMITQNNWFINMGASEFKVEDGDIIKWQYTCSLGADIGCDWSNPSAEISGIDFMSDYGVLSPDFDQKVTEYTYTVPSSTSSICLEAQQENYWSIVTYKSNNKTYKPMEEIPVSDGSIITIDSYYSRNSGNNATDSDSIKITIAYSSDSSGSGSISSSGSSANQKEEQKTTTPQDTSDTTDEKIAFTEDTFPDIKETDWYYDSVKYVYENNLMQGTDNGFEPNSKMTRAMLVTVLWRIAGPGDIGSHSFSDVSADMWYSDAVGWAASNGIVSGVSETEFAPNDLLSREQMALIIFLFAKSEGYDITKSETISHFSDADEVSSWALDAVEWANGISLITGTSDTTLSPKETATRAQVASILMRFCENVAK